MSIYTLKPMFQRALSPVRRSFVRYGVSANQVTAAGLVISGLIGGVFAVAVSYRQILWLVPGLLLARMALNALDGLVARETGTTSESGRVFNEMADVAGDVAAYLPLAILLPDQGIWIAAVVCGGLLTEFAALVGGESRSNRGPFGKSDRAFAFSALAIALALNATPGTWTTLVLVAMLAGASLTVVNRLRHV